MGVFAFASNAAACALWAGLFAKGDSAWCLSLAILHGFLALAFLLMEVTG